MNNGNLPADRIQKCEITNKVIQNMLANDRTGIEKTRKRWKVHCCSEHRRSEKHRGRESDGGSLVLLRLSRRNGRREDWLDLASSHFGLALANWLAVCHTHRRLPLHNPCGNQREFDLHWTHTWHIPLPATGGEPLRIEQALSKSAFSSRLRSN